MSEAGMRYLLEALNAGSMRSASDRLNIAASSISRQISQLEQQLGLALIEKGRRGVKLTHAGEIVIEHYRNQLADREALNAKLGELRSVKVGQATIAVGEGFLGRSFNGLISQFARDNPQINLEILTGSSQEIVRMIVEDAAHVGLVFQTPHDLKLHVRSTAAQPLMAIVPPGHALAERPSVGIAELAEYPLCLPPVQFRIRQILAAAELRTGCHLEPVVTTNSIHVMQEMVRSGVALTVLPQVAVWSELDDGVVIGVPFDSDAVEETTVSLILRSGRQLEGAPIRILKMIEAQVRKWDRAAKAP